MPEQDKKPVDDATKSPKAPHVPGEDMPPAGGEAMEPADKGRQAPEGTAEPASSPDFAHERKEQERRESRGYPEKTVDTGAQRTAPPRKAAPHL